MIGGLAIGVIPFVPLLMMPDVMRRNMLTYVPPLSDWGIGYLLHDLFNYPPFASAAFKTLNIYRVAGRWLILAGVLGLSFASDRLRRWNGYELGTITLILLLVLAPGFGPQYTVTMVPMLLAVSIWRSWMYGLVCGAYLFLTYWTLLISHDLPLESWFPLVGRILPGVPLGLLAWWVLIETAIHLLRRPHESTASSL